MHMRLGDPRGDNKEGGTGKEGYGIWGHAGVRAEEGMVRLCICYHPTYKAIESDRSWSGDCPHWGRMSARGPKRVIFKRVP